jgi:DNA-binding LacI/PurR family transcriptional regulator
MAESKKSKPTMKDVTRLAGVSQTMVSFVINNNPDASIPQESKERARNRHHKTGNTYSTSFHEGRL